jgi:hypothetical protein
VPQKRFVIPVGIALLAMAALATSASAVSFSVAPPTLLSGPSPFASCTIGGPGTNYVNAEVEPWVAINPTNANNIIAVYQADRWSNGGAHGLVAAVTHNFTQPGGPTWNHTFAHFSFCSGGTVVNGGDFERASDPWVTFASNGDVYQSSLSTSSDGLKSAILVSKSTNGGDTWSEPTTLIRDTSVFNFNDKESITADATNSNFVYAVWDRSRKPGENAEFNALHAFAFRGDAMFARTTNAGASWEAPRIILPTNANQQTVGHQIVVLPDGTLVDVFARQIGSNLEPTPNTFRESVVRSTDKGATWSRVIDISTLELVPVRDPDTGATVRTSFGIPDIAVDPSNGTLYVVWEDGRFSGGAHSDIALARSTDGGLTWSAPVKVNQATNIAAAYTPSVHSAADGTVAVTYYDFRNNTPASGALTDYWILHCHTATADCSNAANWGDEARLSPTSFDIEIAPDARGYFLGDYQGLASFGNTFVPFFIRANSGNMANRTDAFATTVGP